MPIYEFYCSQCDRVYNFFPPAVDTKKVPCCPRCQTVRLQRQVSIFARISGKKEGDGSSQDALPPLDEAKMEKAMALLARESEQINADDPRQAAQLMRKLTDTAGITMGNGIKEALSLLEKGEDPDKIEAEMGEVFSEAEPFTLAAKTVRGRRTTTMHSRVDETLYDL